MTLVRLLLLAVGVRCLLRLARGDRALLPLRRLGGGRGRGRRGGREDRLRRLGVRVRRRRGSWRRRCRMRQRRDGDGCGWWWCGWRRGAGSSARGGPCGRPGALHRDEGGHEGERTYERDDTSPPGQLHRCAAKQQAHRLLRSFICRESHAAETNQPQPERGGESSLPPRRLIAASAEFRVDFGRAPRRPLPNSASTSAEPHAGLCRIPRRLRQSPTPASAEFRVDFGRGVIAGLCRIPRRLRQRRDCRPLPNSASTSAEA